MPNLKQFKTREEFNNWYKNYRKSKKWREYHTEYNREWRKENGTSKDTVRKKVFVALRDGKIKKGVCEICGSLEAEAHHDDYSKPLAINWLCRPHHRERDVSLGIRED